MNFVMLPAQTLEGEDISDVCRENNLLIRIHVYHQTEPDRTKTHLCDSQRSPFFLPEQLQRSLRTVKILLRDLLEHVFRQLDVAILVFVIGVPNTESVSQSSRPWTSAINSSTSYHTWPSSEWSQ